MGIRIHLLAILNSNIGITLLIVSLLTKHWAGRENRNIYIYEGLWTRCVDHKHDEGKDPKCKPIGEGLDHYTVIGFLFAACGFHIVNLVLEIILCFKKGVNLHITLAIFQLLTLISTIIGLAIFASEYDNDYFALKWSYAFGWGGGLCMFAALVFNIIGASREKRDRVSY